MFIYFQCTRRGDEPTSCGSILYAVFCVFVYYRMHSSCCSACACTSCHLIFYTTHRTNSCSHMHKYSHTHTNINTTRAVCANLGKLPGRLQTIYCMQQTVIAEARYVSYVDQFIMILDQINVTEQKQTFFDMPNIKHQRQRRITFWSHAHRLHSLSATHHFDIYVCTHMYI